jgi:hypothetical protein
MLRLDSEDPLDALAKPLGLVLRDDGRAHQFPVARMAALNARESAAIIVVAERERRMLLGLLQPRTGRVAEPRNGP